MFKRLCSTALIFGAAALAPPDMAEAQGAACLPRVALIEKLETQYKENLAGGGLQNPQQLLEIWVSEETGSFTVFVTRPDGISCVVATGLHWNSVSAAGAEGVTG